MSGSCCGGPTKSEPAKVAITAARKISEVVVEQLAAKSEKSGRCNDELLEEKKTSCGC